MELQLWVSAQLILPPETGSAAEECSCTGMAKHRSQLRQRHIRFGTLLHNPEFDMRRVGKQRKDRMTQ